MSMCLTLFSLPGQSGTGGAAPSAYSPELLNINASDVARNGLHSHSGLGVADVNFQRGIRFLDRFACGIDAGRDDTVAELSESLQSGDVDTLSSRARGEGVDYDL